MPRRTSSRRRTGTAGNAAAASDGENGCCRVSECSPLPPSPGKRKTRSPVPEDPQTPLVGGLTAPAAIRCTSTMPFQSPKKKALAGGIGDRFNGPLDKENELLCSGNSSGSSLSLSQSDARVGSLQLSAFSAFSQLAPQITRRRGREELCGTPTRSASSSPRAPADITEGSALPFLLTPATVTGSPDIRRTRSSRRTRRSSGRLSQGRESSTSSSGSSNSNISSNNSNNSSSGGGSSGNRSSPSQSIASRSTLTPGQGLTMTPPRRSTRSRSRAGCAAGGRRAATATAPASATPANSAGGGPAGSFRRDVGGARLGEGGGGGSDTVAEPGSSPHRSPIHRLTESLQKWDPGSRIGSTAGALGEVAGTDHNDSCAISSGAASGIGAVKDVGASWSGQELSRTLEKERLAQGLRRRHSAASVEDMYPHERFGDHSPISPASSVASMTLTGFDVGTPTSAGRPWRASPRRAEGVGSVGSVVGSTEEPGGVRMLGSWSDDEVGPSGTAMRLAFSPRMISGAARTLSGVTSLVPTVSAKTATGVAAASVDKATPSAAPWQHLLSPSKGGPPSGNNSSALSRGGRCGVATERDFSASPEQRSVHSVRDVMDHGTDNEKDGSGESALVRRRRRRSRPELELVLPDDAMDVMVESGSGSAPSIATKSGTNTGDKVTLLNKNRSIAHPLGSPLYTMRGVAGEEPECGSASTTACPGWEGLVEDSSSIHESQITRSIGDPWSRGKGGKAKCGASVQSTTSYRIGMGNEREGNVGDGFATETSGAALGISSLSGGDTSSVSDTSASFVRSRPIPDQSAFSSSRLSKSMIGPLSPSGSGGSSSGGGPAAVGPGPVCHTPRKTLMRCPPTPQRTPTWDRWDGLEDSLLLEGVGSGDVGVGSVGVSTRHSLRRSKIMTSSVGSAAGPVGLSIDTGLANASATAMTAALLELEEARGGGCLKGPLGLSSARRGKAGECVDQTGFASSTTASTTGAGAGALGFKHDFVQMGPIGEGGFSVVWKVRARRTGRLYAIKRSKREFRGRRDRDRCLLEARALKRLGEHPGVLRFERAWQEEGHFCLQTELCELGTLKDFLERLPSRKEIPEVAVWQVVQDVGQALRHVHASGLVHLDVKPANLLIGDEGGRLKLADFGMATTYGDGVEGVGDGQEGDTLYMAKELLSSAERLPSADMFSLGLTVYEVATRAELPGDGEDWHAMRDGRPILLPASRSKELGALLRQLMHPDPTRRPTADELCKQPRVANVLGESDSKGSGRGRRGGGKSKSTGKRDDFVYNQARAWKAAEAAAMDHPSSGLRTPTGDMSARYTFQQHC